jgi:hypothetical protein
MRVSPVPLAHRAVVDGVWVVVAQRREDAVSLACGDPGHIGEETRFDEFLVQGNPTEAAGGLDMLVFAEVADADGPHAVDVLNVGHAQLARLLDARASEGAERGHPVGRVTGLPFGAVPQLVHTDCYTNGPTV